MDPGLGLLILVLATAAFAVVNSIEIAVVATNRIRVRHLAEGGSRRARALLALLEDQERFFAGIVLLQNIFATLAAVSGAFMGNEWFGAAGTAAALIIIPAFVTQFGELTPKVLAAYASESYALTWALPVSALLRLLTPVVLLLGIIPGFLRRRIYGARIPASYTEAELRMIIDISAETGSVAEHEAELLDRVFHFGDRRVHEVMVPRTETVWMPKGATVRDFYETFQEHPRSRFPVFEGDPDHVVGIVGIKDVLRAIARGEIDESSSIDPLVREAMFVPETKLVGELFREMQASNTQMAIAVDEYGGTAGIVTLEQLLEEMVGNVADELGLAEQEVTEIDHHTFHIDGGLSIEEAREVLEIDIPEGDYDTLAGYVLSTLGHIPSEGESIPIDGYRITVIEMKGPKIELLRVTRA